MFTPGSAQTLKMHFQFHEFSDFESKLTPLND